MGGSKQLQDGAGVQALSLLQAVPWVVVVELKEPRLLLLMLLWLLCEYCSAGEVVSKNTREMKKLVGTGCSKVHV